MTLGTPLARECMVLGGVQYGDAVRQAVRACRPGEVPALTSLYFDEGLVLGAYTHNQSLKRESGVHDLKMVSRDTL
jgi:hypothetical protein